MVCVCSQDHILNLETTSKLESISIILSGEVRRSASKKPRAEIDIEFAKIFLLLLLFCLYEPFNRIEV